MEMDSDLEEIILYLNANEPTGKYCKNIENLKNKLLKAQEQEKENAEYKKILEIIKEKNVNFDALTDSETLDDYNSKMNWSYRKLTQEEFDLLKRYLNGK